MNTNLIKLHASVVYSGTLCKRHLRSLRSKIHCYLDPAFSNKVLPVPSALSNKFHPWQVRLKYHWAEGSEPSA